MSTLFFKKVLTAAVAFTTISSLTIAHVPAAHAEILIRQLSNSNHKWIISFTRDELPLYFEGTKENQEYLNDLRAMVARILEACGIDRINAERAAADIKSIYIREPKAYKRKRLFFRR